VLGQGKIAEKLRAEGRAVIGGTAYTDRLEDDRGFGQEELKRHGVSILSYETFTDLAEAVAYVRSHPARYVIKPADPPKYKLFVGQEEDGSDVVRMLEAYDRVVRGKKGSSSHIQLQRYVAGVEVAVGAFFNGEDFIQPININFEHKKLFPGNVGPATGEMGTSMFWSAPNKLFNATLRKFETTLREQKFIGYIDLNCIVNANGIYPLEFTSRFGYPTIQIQTETLLMPISEMFMKLARSEGMSLRTKSGFAVGVRVVVPPYPYRDIKTFDAYSRGATVVFKKPDKLEGVHIEDIKQVNGEWVVTGSAGTVLVVIGIGTTMAQAKSQAYSRIGNVLVPNMYYRYDIGDRWVEDSDRLHNWGYLREQ
jgi:phosphoribosylamine--glycine ligase